MADVQLTTQKEGPAVAKIRSLKAEFFRSSEISRTGIIGKVLGAGLICAAADDEGRFKADPDSLRGEIFTHDEVTAHDIRASLDRLEKSGFIRLYLVHGRAFGALLSWEDHQVVPPSRFKKSKLPPPPNTRRRKQGAGIAQADGSNVLPSRAREIGREGIGRDRKGEDISPPAETGGSVLALPTPTEQVFRAWVVSTGKTDRTVLDPKRRGHIQRALTLYPLNDVLAAVRGWENSPHHRGENDRGVQYNDLELLLRDSKHIEMFRDFAVNGPPQMHVPSKPSLGSVYRQAAAQLREAGQ